MLAAHARSVTEIAVLLLRVLGRLEFADRQHLDLVEQFTKRRVLPDREQQFFKLLAHWPPISSGNCCSVSVAAPGGSGTGTGTAAGPCCCCMMNGSMSVHPPSRNVSVIRPAGLIVGL